MKNWKIDKTWATIFVLYLFSLLVRLFTLVNAPIFSDEITWMVRGKEFLYSLIHWNLRYFDTAWWTANYEVKAIGVPLAIINGLFHVIFAGSGKYSLKIVSDIVASRLGVVLIDSVIPVFIYFFGKKFVNKKAAFVAALLYLFNPAVIGIEAWAINDSLLTLFAFLSVFVFFYFAEKRKKSVLPGIFLGLAFLTKPVGVLGALPWIIYLLFKKTKFTLRLVVVNSVSFLITTLILWPASWQKPLISIPEYLFRETKLIKEGLPYYYFGKLSTDPGWTFYLFQIGTRLTELSLVGIILSVFSINKSLFARYKHIIYSVVAYFLVFFLIVTFSPQKLGLRYVLPLIPYVCIVSGLGLSFFIERFKFPQKMIWEILFFVGLIIPVLAFFPDYYLYYNSFVGGPRGAQKYDLVGICSSSKPAFEYLNSIGATGSVFVAGCPAASNYYSSLTVTKNYEHADYIVVETYYRLQYPADSIFNYLQRTKSLKKFRVKGTIIAEVYEN